MSWTDVFPVLTDELVDAYRTRGTPDEETVLAEWFSVLRTINPRSGKHVVAASLFWKNLGNGEGELPSITRKKMMNAGELGLISRYHPWEHYVQPLLDGAAILREARPDVVFRVYLAADLKFLIPDLVAAGCEVKLMRGSSIRHNPGAMWRFLALEEKDRWVTITDSDLARDILSSVERTELIMKSGLGLWRVPYIFASVDNDNHPGFYRPINAAQWGAAGGYPVELLMKAFLWHTMRGTMPDQCTIGPKTKKKLAIYGTDWPTYGFDEWFLVAAIYPRLAFSGVLTFYPINQLEVNHWFSLDIEYVTWANPKSEILYFGKSDLLNRKKKEKTKKAPRVEPPRSPVLERMLAEKMEERDSAEILLPKRKSHSRLTLVVARYSEEVRWLTKVPKGVEIVLYNKGAEISDKRILKRVDHLVALPNRGRESETYLHHIGGFAHGNKDGWTAFCQGDPFPHSPDFLKLLDRRDEWSEVQVLTSGYIEAHDVPPRHARILDDGEWVGGLPVRTELCSAHTLDMLGWQDEAGGRRFFKDYCMHHRIPRGWSISGYFLECCGLHGLAEQAWRSALAQFAYGAMFAVRNERLSEFPKKCIPRMRKLACGHYSNGYVFERLWLHFFGLPFIFAERGAVDERKSQPRGKAKA